MAWRQKDATILLVDVGQTMRQEFAVGSNRVTKADTALSVARSIAQQKMLFMPKHEVSLIFFGTAESRNDLAEDGYPNIFVACDGNLAPADLAMMRALTDVPAGAAESDPVNALIVALDLIIKKTNDAKYSRTIHLMTDGSNVVAGDDDLFECSKQLVSTGTDLHITPVGGTLAPWTYLASNCPKVSLIPLPVLARRSSLSVKPVELRAKVKLNLIISPQIQIPVGIYSRTTRVAFPTLKKRSKMAAQLPPEHQKTDNIVMERTYRVADDPDGEEVVAEDRIKGHRYGQSIVPMSEYDEAALMYTCERTLTALGFAPLQSLGPEHSMGQVESVAADRGDAFAYCAFESLIDAMIAEGVAMIARYVFRQNAQPRMVAIIARKGIDGNSSFMDVQYLPFFEDIREWTCPSLPVANAEQREVVGALVDALTPGGMKSAMMPLKAAEESFQPEESPNPSLSRFYAFLVQRALDKNAGVPPPGQAATHILERAPKVNEALASAKVGELLKAKFGLEKVEKAVGKRKRFWREAMAEKQKDLAFGEVDTKRIKVPTKEESKKEEKVKDEGADHAVGTAGFAAPVGPPPVVHVGSVHPERDFEKWIAHKVGGHDVVGEAMRQIITIIERFAEEGEEFHGKALSCLKVLRKACAQEAEPGTFNTFMRNLNLATGKRTLRFWSRVREAAVSLITDAEVPTSTVSAEEGKAFLSGDSSFASPTAASRAHESAHDPVALLTEQDLEAMID